MEKATTMTVHPAERLCGSIRVPGDKSLSHRMAMLAGLASGTSRIAGFLRAEDCLNTARAMTALGARSHMEEDGTLVMQGTGGKLIAPAGPLDMGNSGTGLRLLTGLLAGLPMTVDLTGDASLRSRPMGRIKDPLERMGAVIELTGERGTAPLRVIGGSLMGIEYAMPVASAQVKSCLLFAGLHAAGRTTIVEPKPARDHTERLLRWMGVPLEIDGPRITLAGYGRTGPKLKGRDVRVPGDISSAAFWLAAAAAMPGAEITIEQVGLNPRRTAVLDVLRRMGAKIEVLHAVEDAEPYGDVHVQGGVLRGVEIGGDEIPNLIDELPVLSAVAALAEGQTVIRDAAELRVKESDRIRTMAGNLKALGVDVEEAPDGMRVSGPTRITGGVSVPSYGDHRVAMSMAVLGLFAREPMVVTSVECIETSYPGFRADMERLGGHVE